MRNASTSPCIRVCMWAGAAQLQACMRWTSREADMQLACPDCQKQLRSSPCSPCPRRQRHLLRRSTAVVARRPGGGRRTQRVCVVGLCGAGGGGAAHGVRQGMGGCGRYGGDLGCGVRPASLPARLQGLWVATPAPRPTLPRCPLPFPPADAGRRPGWARRACPAQPPTEASSTELSSRAGVWQTVRGRRGAMRWTRERPEGGRQGPGDTSRV